MPLEMAEAVVIERKSRFIGRVFPVESEQQALTLLEQVRKRHADASHNCYAYRVRQDNLMRYSDNGEPSGTAGLPMMELLLHLELTNLLLVVTRYFGGTLLGTGGLVRAYTKASQEAIEAAGTGVMTLCDTCLCALEYSAKPRVEALIARFGGVIEHLEYGERLTVTYRLSSAERPAFEAALTDLTLGKSSPRVAEQGYHPLPAER